MVNASVSGETTAGGAGRLPRALAQHHPDILILELGANDGLRGLPLGSARGNLSAMIAASQKTRASVLLVGVSCRPTTARPIHRVFVNFSGSSPATTGPRSCRS